MKYLDQLKSNIFIFHNIFKKALFFFNVFWGTPVWTHPHGIIKIQSYHLGNQRELKPGKPGFPTAIEMLSSNSKLKLWSCAIMCLGISYYPDCRPYICFLLTMPLETPFWRGDHINFTETSLHNNLLLRIYSWQPHDSLPIPHREMVQQVKSWDVLAWIYLQGEHPICNILQQHTKYIKIWNLGSPIFWYSWKLNVN